MGGNQTGAMTMHGGVGIVIDADERVIKRRIAKRFIDLQVASLDEAIALAKEPRRRARRSASPSSATPPTCSRRL